MLTKLHQALAAALKSERPLNDWSANKKVQWELCVKAVATACWVSNAKFDRDRFIVLCGGRFY